jgi:hypothetical protein
MEVEFVDLSPKRLKIVDKIDSFLPTTHKFLDKLPTKWRNKAILWGYKLGIFRQVGYYSIIGYDENGKRNYNDRIGFNIITNGGVTQIRNNLAYLANNTLGNANGIKNLGFGTSTQTPSVSDTDCITPLSGLSGGGDKTRLAGVVSTPGSYEIRIQALITTTYGPTRNYTINEMVVSADPEDTGVVIARALVSPGYLVTGTNTAIATYGLLLR